MLGNEDRRFVGIDSFEFRDATLDGVERNLEAFGLPRPELLVGDVFELVPAGASRRARRRLVLRRVTHIRGSARGLRVAEALLAPGALLIVDDTDWEQVERAMDDYLAEQPRARRILTIDGKIEDSLTGGRECRSWSGTEPRASRSRESSAGD